MKQLTDEEVVRLGNQAEELLRLPGYADIIEHIQQELSLSFLSSTLDDTNGREQTFRTYDGLRLFHNKLRAFMADRDATIERNSQDTEQDDD